MTSGARRGALSSAGLPRIWRSRALDGASPTVATDDECVARRARASASISRFAREVSKAARDMFNESPAQVVDAVMRALRRADDPYPLHGAEVAVRYCSPTNKASQLSPQAFASYLREPWYRIMAEWDEIEVRRRRER